MINSSKPPFRRGKDSEIKRVFKYLNGNTPKTARQIAEDTGIRINHITRHKRTLEKAGLLKVTHKGICPVTKESGVQFLTTNPDLFKDNQLSMFRDES